MLAGDSRARKPLFAQLCSILLVGTAISCAKAGCGRLFRFVQITILSSRSRNISVKGSATMPVGQEAVDECELE
jgi:hypothetical protein